MFLLLALPAFTQSSQIVLSDNTVIYGTVIGMNDGVYTINTDSMGEIRVDASRIVSISSQGSQTQRGAQNRIDIIDESNRGRRSNSSSMRNNAMQEQATMRVQSMSLEDDFLDSLINLSENSAMVDVLNDPEIMDAITNLDYDFLMNSDKMRSLMESSDIQDLLGGY